MEITKKDMDNWNQGYGQNECKMWSASCFCNEVIDGSPQKEKRG